MIGPMFFFPWFLLVLKEIFVTCFFGTVVSFIYFGVGPSLFGWPHAAFAGYTHMQRAMPTTVGTWLDSFAQGWKDATNVLEGACLGRTLWSKVGQFWALKPDVVWIYPETLGKSILSSMECN